MASSPTSSVASTSYQPPPSSAAPHATTEDDSASASKSKAGSKRAFRACLHCRFRKAKCDLGHVDNPKDPPCARCKREGQQCVFAPSRRGGRRSSKKDKEGEDRKREEREIALREALASGGGGGEEEREAKRRRIDSGYHGEQGDSGTTHHIPTGLPPTTFDTPSPTITSHYPQHFPPPLPPQAQSHQQQQRRTINPEQLAAASLHNPDDAVNLLVLASEAAHHPHPPTNGATNGHVSASTPSDKPSPHSTVGSTNRGEGVPPSPSEAPLTSTGRRNGLHVNGSNGASSVVIGTNGVVGGDGIVHGATANGPIIHKTFPLVELGIVTMHEVEVLLAFWFGRMHRIFPMVPVWRHPRTPAQISAFLAEEEDLSVFIIVIASRYLTDGPNGGVGEGAGGDWKLIHTNAWSYLQKRIGDLMLGKPASLGTVEGLLLLSEYLPRVVQPDSLSGGGTSVDVQEEEKRMSWMLVGTAVRLGYMMGLDQKTFIFILPSVSTTGGMPKDEERLHRERLIWTYCYMFDRQASIRLGKAFWSRGPGLCFQQSGDGNVNFPSLADGEGEDGASLVQAYVDLTQTMTSAHDILYPSKDRTVALVRVGEYYKYLDEFTRSINAFRLTWEHKRWERETVGDCVWVYFHYLRLYISSFAFQAHVQRAMPNTEDVPMTHAVGTNGEDADGSHGPGHGKKSFDSVIFPKGVTGSPDAKFILEGIDAATELVKIATERLHPRNDLTYLPWRFFLFFSYAAVFLLKALFIGAVVPVEQRSTVHLLKKLILCLAKSSTDDGHPGVRYARLLNAMLRTFSRGADSVEVFSGPSSISPTPNHTLRPAGPSLPHHLQQQSQGGKVDAWPVSAIQSPNLPSAELPGGGVIDGLGGGAGQELGYHHHNGVGGLSHDTNGGQQPHIFDIFSLSTAGPSAGATGGAAVGEGGLGDTSFDGGMGMAWTANHPPPEEFSMLLNDYEALDSDFWRSLSMQPGDWNFGSSGYVVGGEGVGPGGW